MAPRKKKTVEVKPTEILDQENPWGILENAFFKGGNDDVITILSEGKGWMSNFRDQQGNNVWHVCASFGRNTEGLVDHLLFAHPGMKFDKNDNGNTPVSIAIANGFYSFTAKVFSHSSEDELKSHKMAVKEFLAEPNISFALKMPLLDKLSKAGKDAKPSNILDAFAGRLKKTNSLFEYPEADGFGDFIKKLISMEDDPTKLFVVNVGEWKTPAMHAYFSTLQAEILMPKIKPGKKVTINRTQL